MKLNYKHILLGPLLALVLYNLKLDSENDLTNRMAAIAFWMGYWWLSEAVNFAVTAFIPIIFLPLFGIADSKIVAMQYMDPILFLFIGGFLIAFAIEKWNLHERLALFILKIIGSKPSQILLGIMISAFILSMWISNTATTMMLLSAVLALIYKLEKIISNEEQKTKISSALLLGLAYAATIGGLATLVGTPTNMIFYRAYLNAFPNTTEVTFISWFIEAFPFAVLFLAATFFVLKLFFLRNTSNIKIAKSTFIDSYKALGKWSLEEKLVLIIFLLTAILWFTRADLKIGSVFLKGWSSYFPNSDYIHDSVVAMFMALLLFIIPSKNKKGEFLLNWQDAEKLPFDIILMFGGGFAMAKGFELSGLTLFIANQLKNFETIDFILLLAIILIVITIVSEFASNVACIQLMLPILFAISSSLNINPLKILIPATLAASFGFMLPIATAPNTIVFAVKRIQFKDMIKVGLVLDVIAVILVLIYSQFFY